MLTDDQKEAYYRDLVCNSYCPVEVPSAVRELQRTRQLGLLEAMRAVLTERIVKEARLGGTGKYPPAHVQEMLDEINRPTTVYYKRLKARLYTDMEARKARNYVTVNLNLAAHRRLQPIAAERNITLSQLLNGIVNSWLADRTETRRTVA
jgi:hypothetical protein